MSALVSTACALAIACGSSAAAPKTPVTKPPLGTTPVAACAPAGEITLADGTLHCKELPVSIAFPAGARVTRQNDKALTLYAATLDRGVMALIAEPRADTPSAAQFQTMLEGFVKNVIAADATTKVIDAPPRDGATIAIGLSFTTPDGGSGVIHGYFANHWLVAAVTGGRLATTPSRPDQPAGKAFLASLALHPLAAGNRAYPLSHAELEIPAAAWSIGKQPSEPGSISEEIFMSPATGVWIGVREVEARERCNFLAGKQPNAPQELADRFKAIYANAPLTAIEKAPYGEVSVYANADAGTMHLELLFACVGDTALQLSVGGAASHSELRPHLDAIAQSLRPKGA